MRFYVAVDLEGTACTVGLPGQFLTPPNPNYYQAARQATREADAAARALFDEGADEVVVWDNHGSGVNLDYDLLDARCKIALGSGWQHRWPLLDESWDGVLMIGYHPMDNTPDAVLSHTYSSATYQYYKINGVQVGEMQIDAAMAGRMGVPVLFVSSDDKGAAQARESFPWAETVSTKRSLSYHGAVSLHPARACEEIYSAVRRAAGRRQEMRPFTFASPLEVEIRFKKIPDAKSAPLYDRNRRPFAQPDAYTRVGQLDDIADLF